MQSNLARMVDVIVASIQPRFNVVVETGEECVKLKVRNGDIYVCRVAFNRFTDEDTGGNGFVISDQNYATLSKGRDNLGQLLKAFEQHGIRA